MIGISASADFAYWETYLRGVNGLAFIAGAEFDLDFYTQYSVTLGFIVNYNITSQPELVYVNNSFAYIWKAKIAYTKARDFRLGIEYMVTKVPTPNMEQNPTIYTIALSSRYYF